jgi:hypothetical protein
MEVFYISDRLTDGTNSKDGMHYSWFVN